MMQYDIIFKFPIFYILEHPEDMSDNNLKLFLLKRYQGLSNEVSHDLPFTHEN